MGADFAAFFEYANVDFLAGLGRQLLESDRGRQAGGAAADYHHVVFHCFARAVLRQQIDCFSHEGVPGLLLCKFLVRSCYC